jgi:Spy/CpxP family protein refolding chaperone
MTKKLSIFLTGIFAVLFATAFGTNAQEVPAERENVAANQPVRPFKLFQELGLSPEQVRQLRLINQERKAVVNAAQIRARIANRKLDEAVYADGTTSEMLQELTREAQLAQGALLKERIETEFRIRSVLTPEQLVRFRELRTRLQTRQQQRLGGATPAELRQQRTRTIQDTQRRNNNRP